MGQAETVFGSGTRPGRERSYKSPIGCTGKWHAGQELGCNIASCRSDFKSKGAVRTRPGSVIDTLAGSCLGQTGLPVAPRADQGTASEEITVLYRVRSDSESI